MNNLNDSLAVITGASSGIGLEFAFVVAERTNHEIVIIARRNERLLKLKNEILNRFPNKKIHILSYDLSIETERAECWNSIEMLNKPVALLINNAGYGSFGLFQDSNLNNELKMIKLNCMAIVDFCYKAIPNMIKQNEGNIINVSSMASFQGLPFLSTYSSTKSFVTSFSLALASEVEKYGIKVQALCPGPVATEFGQVAGFKSKISFTSSISARSVAELSIKSLDSDRRVVIPGFMNFILAQANRLVPRALASKLAYLMLSNKFGD